MVCHGVLQVALAVKTCVSSLIRSKTSLALACLMRFLHLLWLLAALVRNETS
jgi:hypothetical protein